MADNTGTGKTGNWAGLDDLLGSLPMDEITNVTTANATDLPTAIALANANKAKINELLNALRGTTILTS